MYLLVRTFLKSQQEPRLMAHYANDQSMIDAYRNKKDLYATIATQVYNNDYWDNMENYEDGSPNPEGTIRRSNCKSIALGLLYGRGTNSVAEQIGSTFEEAQQLIDKFFAGFPSVNTWIKETQEGAYANGYVEDVMGRRRRLPDLQLPKYSCEESAGVKDFNPLLQSSGINHEKSSAEADKYIKQLEQATTFKQRSAIKAEAANHGIKIQDNTGFISRAERQCVNARVQGGAATITKLAMIEVFNDSLLRDLKFDLLLCIHDELIGECPRENAEAVADRLSELMINAAAKVCKVPMKCDATITSRWYEGEATNSIHNRYKHLEEEKGKEAFNILKEEYSVINPSYLEMIAQGTYQCGVYDTI